MFRLYTCITEDHDIRLVVVAGLICLLATFTAFSLLRRALAASAPRVRLVWLGAAALVTGSGVWTTHFVAMLAYTSYLPIQYDALRTGISVVIAIAVSSVGLEIALRGHRDKRLTLLGGAVVGVAVGAMHYVGMSAMEVPASIVWNPGVVVVSLLLGVVPAAASLAVAFRRADFRHRVAASVLLTLGICSLHFTAMTAFELQADPGFIALLDQMQDLTWLALSVAVVTVMIVSLALVGAIVDQRLADRALREAERLRETVAQLEATKRELEGTAASLTRALEAAAASSQAKSQFLATMSHELRTPLNAVIGFSQLLEREIFGPLGDARYRDYVRTISESGTHLLNLINDVLDFSKSEAGKLELYEEELDLSESVAHVLRIVSGQAHNAQVTLVFEPAPGIWHVRADEKRVRQVLLNLLSNAIKFTPAGGKVAVRIYERNRMTALDVADTGIGIAAEDMPIALERFGQVDRERARKHEGTGLGLPLSKRLMELHGGELELQSTPGAGTTVTILFPEERIVSTRHAA
jgi:signal transduction histidine kinase